MRRVLGGIEVWLTVISAGRPGNVHNMFNLIGPATWYVPDDQWREYSKAQHEMGGSSQIGKGSDTNVCHARNRAMEDAFKDGLPCVQLDDDMKWIKQVEFGAGDEKNVAKWCAPEQAIGMIAQELERTDYKLAGTAPTNNPFFSNLQVHTRAFVRSPLWVIKPNELRLDEQFLVKFDYDYTLQHIHQLGGVCRVDGFVTEFDYGKQKGGHVDTRTLETQHEAIRRLEKKWGNRVIRRNPRRDGEILLRIPKPSRTVYA